MSDRPTSFHDFKWACGHTGPGYCKTCRDEQIEAKDKRIAELEGWTKVSLGLKCPSCDDDGWFAIQTDHDKWEQQQCEFCYTVPDSIFNRRAAATKENE